MATKPMSKQQLEHLQIRLDEEVRRAVEQLKKTLPKCVFLTDAQKIAAIKSGKATLVREDSYRLLTAFDYKAEVPAHKQAEKNKEAIKKVSDALQKRITSIMDAAILGGADEALAQLEKFTAYTESISK